MNWQDKINTVWQGDCLELMKEMPDKSVDLCLTDPPYGIGNDGQKESISKNPKHNRKKHDFGGWDCNIPSLETFEEIRRVSKQQIIFGGNYFITHLKEGHKGWIVWDKGQRGLTMSDGELAYSSFDSPLRIITINRAELIRDFTQHPTQKPVKLLALILRDYSEIGQTIFDPFMGSWTTAVAAKQLGRNFIGAELSEKYCEIGRQRLRQEVLL